MIAKLQASELEKLMCQDTQLKIWKIVRDKKFDGICTDIFVDDYIKERNFARLSNRLQAAMFVTGEIFSNRHPEASKKISNEKMTANLIFVLDAHWANLIERIERCAAEVDRKKRELK